MQSSIIIAVVIVLVVLIIRNYHSNFSIEKTKLKHAKLDGLPYRVHENHEQSDNAADLLAALNERILNLMRYMRDKYLSGNAPNDKVQMVKNMLQRYNPDNLMEVSPNNPDGDTAYSLDKGAIMAICLRSHSGELHDLDVITFVAFHELAHIAIDAIDHPLEFWQAFKFILDSAAESRIYFAPNYTENPVEYCGMMIEYSPNWDKTLLL